jgi:hypothetical protein
VIIVNPENEFLNNYVAKAYRMKHYAIGNNLKARLEESSLCLPPGKNIHI